MQTSRRAWAFALAALVLAGCQNDPLSPDEALDLQITEDVATAAADAVLDDVAQMAVNDLLLPAAMVAGPVTRTRTVAFFDEQGAEQTGYDPVTTDSIHILVSVEGSVERDTWSASISRERDLSVSGLAGAETSRTWNGTGSSDVTGSRHVDSAGTRTYDLSSTSTIDNVVVGIPRSENPWPLSGTITRSVTVTLTSDAGTITRSRTVTVEFNGTQFAIMTIGDESWEIDLSARAGDRAHRHRPHHG